MFSVSVPIFVLLAAVVQCSSAEKYAYVKGNLPSIKCTDIPNDGICPRDHKIPDFTNIPDDDGKPQDFSNLSAIINATLTQVDNLFKLSGLVNDTCTNSYRSFACSQILPDCEDGSDFFTRNGEKTLKLCEEAVRACNASGLDPIILKTIINCSLVNSTSMKIQKSLFTCSAYSDVKSYPYQCLPRNYKGLVHQSVSFNETAKVILEGINSLKMYENELGKKCVDDVSKMICDATSRACSRDEQYVVDVVSKQDCQMIMECLNVVNETNLIEGAFGLCNHLENATTAQKIPLSDVYLPVNRTTYAVNTTVTVSTTVASTTKSMTVTPGPTQGTSCVMISFVFLHFMLFLSSTYVTSG